MAQLPHADAVVPVVDMLHIKRKITRQKVSLEEGNICKENSLAQVRAGLCWQIRPRKADRIWCVVVPPIQPPYLITALPTSITSLQQPLLWCKWESSSRHDLCNSLCQQRMCHSWEQGAGFRSNTYCMLVPTPFARQPGADFRCGLCLSRPIGAVTAGK